MISFKKKQYKNSSFSHARLCSVRRLILSYYLKHHKL